MNGSRLLAWGLLIVVACGSDVEPKATTSTGTSTGSGGNSQLPEPQRHREAAETCTGMPPAGNPIPDDTGECMDDGECTDGTNGRCVWPYAGGNVCMYDECNQDADCGGASVCACRVGFGFNTCYQGNCKTDADCPRSYCSPSAVHISASCMTGISPGSVGFFCRTASDACVDDADCGGEGSGACIFSVESTSWVCQELLCTG